MYQVWPSSASLEAVIPFGACSSFVPTSVPNVQYIYRPFFLCFVVGKAVFLGRVSLAQINSEFGSVEGGGSRRNIY